jgi:hypothetical protein
MENVERKKTMPKLTSVKVALNIPYLGGVEGTWEPDEAEQRAAWDMYVELVTRISVVELRPGEGLLHEALTSLYSLFDTTRRILREYGPSIARPKGKDNISFGYLAIAILNGVLRPVLAKWHPLFLQYQTAKPESISPVEYEWQWANNEQLLQELNNIRGILIEYVNLLAEVAKVPPLRTDV